MNGDKKILSRDRYDAVIFDLDGVITDTAKVHFAAWKEVFDELLRRHVGDDVSPFSDADYRAYVDGKPRHDGIRSFVQSRGLELDEGDPGDDRGFDTVEAVAKAKNQIYRRRIADGGLEVFDEAVEFVERLGAEGFGLGLVSSSKNAKFILETAEIDDLFEVRVDGVTLAEEKIAGKPAPDMFVEAARRLGVEPSRAVVVEDAESGVEAGRTGGFGLVVGRADDAEQRRRLLARGADVAVMSLGEFEVGTR